MLTLPGSIATQWAEGVATSGHAGQLAWLVELQFATGTQRLTTWPVDTDWNGFTWQAVGTLLNVGVLSESDGNDNKQLELALKLSDPSWVALALTDATEYQGRLANVWLMSMTPEGAVLGAVFRAGYLMDVLDIDEPGQQILLRCEDRAQQRSRAAAMRLNDAQQQARFPGDTSLSRIEGLVASPFVLLTRRFQATLIQ